MRRTAEIRVILLVLMIRCWPGDRLARIPSLPARVARRWNQRRTGNTRNEILAQLLIPKSHGRVEDGAARLSDGVVLSVLYAGSLLLLCSCVVGNTPAELAGMLAVERLGQAGLHPKGGRIFNDHSHPGGRLKNCPMSANKLEDGHHTENLGTTLRHG
jgi:hypothetical protein